MVGGEADLVGVFLSFPARILFVLGAFVGSGFAHASAYSFFDDEDRHEEDDEDDDSDGDDGADDFHGVLLFEVVAVSLGLLGFVVEDGFVWPVGRRGFAGPFLLLIGAGPAHADANSLGNDESDRSGE